MGWNEFREAVKGFAFFIFGFTAIGLGIGAFFGAIVWAFKTISGM